MLFNSVWCLEVAFKIHFVELMSKATVQIIFLKLAFWLLQPCSSWIIMHRNNLLNDIGWLLMSSTRSGWSMKSLTFSLFSGFIYFYFKGRITQINTHTRRERGNKGTREKSRQGEEKEREEWREREREKKERREERNIFHPLINSLNSHNGHGWVHLKQ